MKFSKESKKCYAGVPPTRAGITFRERHSPEWRSRATYRAGITCLRFILKAVTCTRNANFPIGGLKDAIQENGVPGNANLLIGGFKDAIRENGVPRGAQV